MAALAITANVGSLFEEVRLTFWLVVPLKFKIDVLLPLWVNAIVEVT